MLNIIFKERFTFLLVFVLIYTMAAPFFKPIVSLSNFLNFSFSAVLISSVYVLKREKNNWVAVCFFILPCFVIIWLKNHFASSGMIMAGSLSQAVFAAYMVIVIILFIFETPVVTRNIISAALVAYLFISLFWAKLFFILEIVYPGSFSISHDLIMATPSVLEYVSFVTITTLGYGDITPISSQARSLASLEAFIGQIYLAVLIARLVGIQAAQSMQGR